MIEELKPSEDDLLIYKKRYSGFFQTDLDISLREEGIIELKLMEYAVISVFCILGRYLFNRINYSRNRMN